MPTLVRGAAAPGFGLRGTDHARYSLQDAIASGPVLAAFFKVGCPTCQFAFPFVERLHKQFGGKGAAVWGISQDSAADTRSFAERFNIRFPLLIDENHYATSKSYQLKYTPTLFLISSEGRIELASEGFAKSDFLEIHRQLGDRLRIKPEPLFSPAERIPEYKPG